MDREVKLAMLRVAEAAAAVIAMRAAVESWDRIKELAGEARRDAVSVLDRIRDRIELERTVRASRNGVVFEAWLAAREGATDGRD